MSSVTNLEPLPAGRATELLDLMREGQDDGSKGLALDERGFVTGTVDVANDSRPHVLGDFDVHA